MKSFRTMLHLKPRNSLALEDDAPEAITPNPEDQIAIVMKGPLSEIYTDALDQVYAKGNDSLDDVAANVSVEEVETQTPAGKDTPPGPIESEAKNTIVESDKAGASE